MSRRKLKQLTKDNFIDLLDVQYIQKIVHDEERMNKIYEAVAYYASEGKEEKLEQMKIPDGLQFKVPKLPIHFNLTQTVKEDLKNIITAGLIATSQPSLGSIASISATLILSAAKNISVLERANGEDCIVESLAENKSGKSIDVFNALSALDCRHPKNNCVFFDKSDGLCGVSLESIIMTLTKLEDKKIVTRVQNIPAIQWKVVT